MTDAAHCWHPLVHPPTHWATTDRLAAKLGPTKDADGSHWLHAWQCSRTHAATFAPPNATKHSRGSAVPAPTGPFLIGCFPAVPPAPCTMKRWKRPLTPRTAQPTGPSRAAHRARTEGAAEGAIRGCRLPQGQARLRKRLFCPPAHLTAFIRRSCHVQTSFCSTPHCLSSLDRQSLAARQNFYLLLWGGVAPSLLTSARAV